jgi:hypothetical protein
MLYLLDLVFVVVHAFLLLRSVCSNAALVCQHGWKRFSVLMYKAGLWYHIIGNIHLIG